MDNITPFPAPNPYKKMYAALFNAVTDALNMMEDRDYGAAQRRLMSAQREAEELYLDSGETDA